MKIERTKAEKIYNNFLLCKRKSLCDDTWNLAFLHLTCFSNGKHFSDTFYQFADNSIIEILNSKVKWYKAYPQYLESKNNK